VALRQFSDQHLAALTAMLVGIAGCVWVGRRHRGRWPAVVSWALAAVVLAGWIGENVAEVIVGTWSTKYALPLQLTDAVSAVTVAALLTRRPLLVELSYFWAFTASLQAVVTPDLAYAFPSAFYLTYFAYHVGAIVAASFLVFGLRIYPRPGAVRRVYLTTLGFASVAGVADLITGGNYMYLRAKPAHSSLLNVIGPWPWYIAGTAAVGLAMLLIVAAITDALRGLAEERTDRGSSFAGSAGRRGATGEIPRS
jgi:hypothetical integral membrane protein (TIGR02206 family)